MKSLQISMRKQLNGSRITLVSRTQYVTIGDTTSMMKNVTTGIPQGSVLGPTLYSIYVNELADVINDHENCTEEIHKDNNELFGEECNSCGKITNYADDTTFHISNKKRTIIQEIITVKLEKLKTFLTTNKLTINMTKTSLMEIMMKQKRSKLKGEPPTLQVRSNLEIKVIKSKTECFLLGGTLQNNMSWQSHIDNGEMAILQRMRSKIGALRFCCSKLPTKSRKLLASSLVVSKLLYLLPVVGGTCKKYKEKMQVTLNNAARFATGLGKRAKKETLMKATGWMDVEGMIDYHSIIQMWRTLHFQVPRYLFKKLTISENNTIETSNPRIQNTEGSYRWRTVKLWNEMTEETRNIDNIIILRKQ